MSPDKKSQTMKPLTAANKLGIYLPAAPEEFRNNPISRAELDALREAPPTWLEELHRAGPFPRDVVAKKLGVSNAGLARGGVTDALTAEQIAELDANPPEWLVRERATFEQVQKDNARIKADREAKRAASNRPAKNR